MANRLAILCPGQGAQHAEMFAFVCAEGNELAHKGTLESVMGMPVEQVLANEKLLFSNRAAQPLIVASAVATWAAIADIVPEPVVVAGYSIGELSAYCIAGALHGDSAIELAAVRARLMDDCAQAPQAMLSVSGLNIANLKEMILQAGCYSAIENGEENVIAGGAYDAVLVLQKHALAHGARTSMLPVGVASHTPMLHEAAIRFKEVLEHSHLSNPRIPVLSGIDAQRIHSREQAITVLAFQIEQTIRWADCMDACAEAGTTLALELGPGSALSRMLHARHPQIECRSVGDFRTKAGLKTWLAAHS
jgi:[acyl-carrier-protein] S-malonyltransferase